MKTLNYFVKVKRMIPIQLNGCNFRRQVLVLRNIMEMSLGEMFQREKVMN